MTGSPGRIRAPQLDNPIGTVMVPQRHVPGAEAEVDFGLFSAYVGGVLEPLWMFCMRLSASGRGHHEAFANQAIEPDGSGGSRSCTA